MKKVVPSQTVPVCAVLVATLLTLLPFHAFLTVWAGSVFGHYDWIRLWIEFVLLVAGALAVWALYHQPRLRAMWCRSSLVWVTAAYGGWQLAVGLVALAQGGVTASALVTGWIIDLRFVAFLLVCWLAATQYPWLAARWRELTLIPAALVVGFGVLQAWLLPPDVLKHVGYGSATIAPSATVDNKDAYTRIQSTLRGPNPLGAYLVIVVSALVVQLAKLRNRLWRGTGIVFLAAASVTLGATYSRSAYIGAVLAVAAAAWLLSRSARARRLLLIAGALCAVLAVGTLAVLRNNDRLQNTLFHTDEHSTSGQSSNAVRASSLSQGARDVLSHPLGTGPGTAGPASVRNSHPRIAENYYLQVGQEVGWPGLVLFVALVWLVALELWRRRSHQLAVVLLASLVGISFINMLSHAWADDTLSMLWWGLAGIALSLPANQLQVSKERAS